MSSSAQSEAGLENDEAPVKLMDKTRYYFSRDFNPWPTPPPPTTGTFRKAGTGGNEPSTEPKKKYGGGFGGSNFFGHTMTSFNDFSGFAVCKEKRSASTRPSLFGSGILAPSSRLAAGDSSVIAPSKDNRSATPTPSETTIPSVTTTRRSGITVDYARSEVVSPTKRPRSGRRTGRRGRSGPGHCFHCQEHGHISRLCPKKTVEDTDEFDEVEASRFLDDEILSGAPKTTGSLAGGRDPGTVQNAKLENQKARESYYGGYGYGSNNNSSSTTTTNTTANTATNSTIASKTVTAMTAKYATVGAAVSPESDKFSEQLDNALKLHVAKPPPPPPPATTTTPPPPRGLTTSAAIAPKAAAPAGGRISSNNKTAEAAPVKSTSLGLRDRIKEISSETLTIETRRTVTLEGDTRFEETTIISFPSVLPPNVRVITAQFVPVSSQVPGEIIKEKF